ncbi:KR domain-containing protein [Fomitopsis serialis]|uniref:KR domain-containing protein n=1 Tax=Fomitopsis serialis TaxID=139415 RepID=UPI0020088BBA|nr:KR domain-containing protein [Neoantrodia serialis]KAH9914757.1 KR domain-containing protein [Neoantrodia serialis]
MPAAGFIEMALEYGATTLMNVDMRSILSLSSERPMKVDISRDGFLWAVKTSISSSHAASAPTFPPYVNDAKGILDPVTFYHSLAYFSAYGACFRRVTEVFYGYHEALVSIKGMDDALERDGRYLLHPAILDACLHITSYRPFHGDHGPNNYYLPAHVDAVILHCPPRAHFFPEHIYTHTVLKKWTPSSVFYDIIIADDAGTPLCTLEGLEVAKHQFNPPPEDLIPYDVGLQRSVLPLLSDTRDKVNGHKLDQFNGNAASTKQHEDQCADAVIDHISALREVVEQVSRQSGSVVRLLAHGTEFPRTDHFTHLLDGFPLLLFDISAQPGRASQDVSPRRGTVRTSNIDLANLGSNHPAYFDIISTFLPEGDPYVAQLSRILVPGGLLVLTTRSDLPVVNGHKAHGIERLSQALHDAGLTIRRTLIAPGGSSPTFTAWCQRTESSADGVPAPPVFDPDEAFVFHYAQGHEMDLQWDFSGLDPVDALDVWVLVAEGRDGGAALGLVRALRLEYLSWTIHVVVFPLTLLMATRPREKSGQIADQMDPGVECEGSILLEVQGVSGSAIVKGVLGLEMNRSNSWTSTNPNNGPVVAIAQGPVGKYVTVRREATSRLSPRLNRHSTMIMQCIPSVVAGILAQGTHTFSNDKRCRGLRVLVTHSDTATGMTVIWMYRRQGITVVGLPADATPLHLSSALRSGFNLVVSGYTDPSYIQLLRSASCPKGGKMYFWDDPHEGLAWALRNDLWSVQDALELALTFLEERTDDLEESLPTVEPRTATFSPHKTYLVLGGIGNLGAHVAWMLYRHGARRLVVTSRRGAASLQTTSNRLVRRTFEYLRSLPDLDLRLSATNASDIESMAELLRGIPEEAPLAGCIVLTAALSDRTFARLEEADFASVYESKIGVVDTLRECVDVGALEFLVRSHPWRASLEMEGRRTTAPNTAMEEQVSAYPNAFAFVCPGIIDSTMMRSSELGESGKVAQLEQFAQWGITAEDMILWLEDALARFQAGERFARYVPTVDWYALERTRGMPLLGRHLLSTPLTRSGSSAAAPGRMVGAADEGGDVGIRMAAIVRGVLGVAAEDFSPETPFTAYGVDSLSAARLAFMLRPLVEVTQLQLLADMSLEGLEVLAGKGKKEEGV